MQLDTRALHCCSIPLAKTTIADPEWMSGALRTRTTTALLLIHEGAFSPVHGVDAFVLNSLFVSAFVCPSVVEAHFVENDSA